MSIIATEALYAKLNKHVTHSSFLSLSYIPLRQCFLFQDGLLLLQVNEPFHCFIILPDSSIPLPSHLVHIYTSTLSVILLAEPSMDRLPVTHRRRHVKQGSQIQKKNVQYARPSIKNVSVIVVHQMCSTAHLFFVPPHS